MRALLVVVAGLVLPGVLALTGCTAAKPGPAEAPSALSRSPARVDELAWLAGTWRAPLRGGIVEESWTAPAGGTMLGTGRVTDGGATRSWEFQRIEQRGALVVLVAQPQGGPATEFVLTEAAPGRAVFSNPSHDFPQHIAYRRAPGAVLEVAVRGVEGGTPRHESYFLGLAVVVPDVARD